MLGSFAENLVHGLCVCVTLGTYAVPTKSDDIQLNTAIVTFSGMSISSWNSDGKTAKFKDVVAAVSNGYCLSNYDSCALRFWNVTRTFRTTDVIIESNYPNQAEKDIEIRFYVVLPSGDDIRKQNFTVLPRATLDSILEANSTQIGSAVDAQVKSKADGTGGTNKPKADDTLDYIMIPVGFGLLIFVIALACCLHFCHKRKLDQIKKEERRQFFLKQKSESNSKPQSPFQAEPVKQIPEVTVKPQQRQKPRLNYENEQDIDQDVNEKEQKPLAREKERRKAAEEKNDNLYDNVDGSYFNEECEEINKKAEDVSEESDHERRRAKRRKKKKRRHKKQNGSPQHEGNYGYESDEDDARPPHVLDDDDISSRLPPPRKLPPLRGQTTKM